MKKTALASPGASASICSRTTSASLERQRKYPNSAATRARPMARTTKDFRLRMSLGRNRIPSDIGLFSHQRGAKTAKKWKGQGQALKLGVESCGLCGKPAQRPAIKL